LINAVHESQILPNQGEFENFVAQVSVPLNYAQYHANILSISVEEEAGQ
jgi:hypothetical protein